MNIAAIVPLPAHPCRAICPVASKSQLPSPNSKPPSLAYHGPMILPAAFLISMIAQASPAIAVIPQPVKVTERTGRFTITPTTVVWSDAASTC